MHRVHVSRANGIIPKERMPLALAMTLQKRHVRRLAACALGVLARCVHAQHVLELHYNGRECPLSFSADDDLEAIAGRWAAEYPGAVGAGCENRECVVSTLVSAMRSELSLEDASYEAARLHYASMVNAWNSSSEADANPEHLIEVVRDARRICVDNPRSKAAVALGAIEALAASDYTSLAFGLEQVAGFCYCAAEARAHRWATQSPEAVSHRRLHRRLRSEPLDEPSSSSGRDPPAAAHAVAAYAALSAVAIDELRVHALKFGGLAALEMSEPVAAARFSSRLASLKRPASGGSLIDPERREVHALPWTISAPGIAVIDEALEFGHAQFGGLHDAALDFAAEQMRWIAQRRSCDADVEGAAEGLELLADAAREWRAESGGALHAPLAELARRRPFPAVDRALETYGRLVCLNPGPELERTVRPFTARERENVEDQFAQAGVAVVDDFLTDDAIRALRDFVLGSTIFTRGYVQGYLGAFLADGFGASPVVAKLADELRTTTFPDLLAGARLRQAWAYVYPRRSRDGSSHPKGIDAHADDADVSVNIWITPDAANGGRGGLVVYGATQPADWTFAQANQNSTAVYDFLDQSAARDATITVPYKFNRATLLDGFRFHQTDSLDFKPGLENHRINLTFLFKLRDRRDGQDLARVCGL